MFRVKIDLGVMRHHEIKKTDTGVSDSLGDRLGDWAEELAKLHPQSTREDLCRTFRDKLRDGDKGDRKTVA